jgi:two-component system phosphate regulon sensor histidine kinase PhoR
VTLESFLIALLLVAVAVLSAALYWLYTHPRQVIQPPDPEIMNRLSALEGQVKQLKAQHAEAQQELAKADEIILRLRRSLAESDSTIAELREQLENSHSVVANLRGQISTSELGIAESRALYAAVSIVAYDIVFVLNEELIVIATNHAGDAFFRRGNPVGEPLSAVVDSPELIDLISHARHEDEGLEEQLLIGNSHFRVRTKVLQYDSRHAFIGVALQDITQLVRLNRARRDMVANISHELRTPIASIRMIIEGLFHEQEKPKRKASISTLRAIMRETDSLLWLVQELLDLSMIESGQAIIKLLPNSLLEIVHDSTDRLADFMARKHLKAVVHVPERLQVLCDWEQTRRVFINLIHNAIKWSPEYGAITISASYRDDEVLVSVFDTGPGVPDDQRERIFERFYQVDTSRSEQGGSGLGLAICKHIVEAQGGRIWAEGNSLGRGGRFFFTLMAAEEASYQPQPEMQRGQHDLLPAPSAQTSNALPISASEDEATVEFVDDEASTA